VSPSVDVWSDPELHELLRDEPELLAIADALAQSGPAAMRRRGLPVVRAASLAAALVAATAVALAAPWSSSSSNPSDQALAAVGSGPVLHLVAEWPPSPGLVVDLATGATQPVVEQQEIWYDGDLGLRREVTRIGPAIVDDVLETPAGGFTPRGIVYDCAWIAAHPVQATGARVSCNASGANGTTPHAVARPRPTLDPGLAGFADGYQAVLAAGRAKDGGSGEIDGRPVEWLLFAQRGGGTEKVALDTSTHEPVELVEPGGRAPVRILSIATIPYVASDFTRPIPSEVPDTPSSRRWSEAGVLTLDGRAIAAAMPGALWAGMSLAGLPLAAAEQESLSASFADGTPAETGTGVRLEYGTAAVAPAQPTEPFGGPLDASQPFVQISESPSADLTMGSAGWPPAGTLLGRGQLYELNDQPVATGTLIDGGVYVTIRASSRTLLLTAARALTTAA
jgi:hypothetical protein